MVFSMFFLIFMLKDPNLAENLTNLADILKKLDLQGSWGLIFPTKRTLDTWWSQGRGVLVGIVNGKSRAEALLNLASQETINLSPISSTVSGIHMSSRQIKVTQIYIFFKTIRVKFSWEGLTKQSMDHFLLLLKSANLEIIKTSCPPNHQRVNIFF